MTDTKETKLCPFRKMGILPPRLVGDREWATFAQDLAPCLEDKCQIWREWVLDGSGLIVHGCGLAGKT